MQNLDVCDVCTGSGKTLSGVPCMCGGTGRMSNAAYYLREQLVKTQLRLERIEQALKDYSRRCALAPDDGIRPLDTSFFINNLLVEK